MNNIVLKIANELKIKESQVSETLKMLQDGDTVAFIARYRKGQTSGLDEEQILFIEKEFKYQTNLEERKLAVIDLIATQGKMTDDLKKEILACEKLSQVEDLYKPYKQKKKTRAATAIKNGLEPLANLLLSLPSNIDIIQEASKYINETVLNAQEAINGAKDIIAEVVSDNAKLRWKLKEYIESTSSLKTTLKKNAIDEKKVYEMYYDHSEKISTIANHRIMAIDRAEKEKVLSVEFVYDNAYVINETNALYITKKTNVVDILKDAIKDGLNRLLLPSIENEIRSDLSLKAANSSIEIFSLNLEKLLSQPALKGRIVLGFDPGFYNGCKLAVIDQTGKMLEVTKVFPFRKENTDFTETNNKLIKLINKYNVKTIAIGNGTASRESEKLVADLIKNNNLDVNYAIVSEAGASVWSAQEQAREEFPDLQVEERSAVSIARRLLDPLSELIKIDPKSIGVGQYQHDLPQKQLSERLDEATFKVVNRVGADINTASVELLTHISGLNKAIALEIVNYRNLNGKFTNRKQLLNVKKIGEKSFKQAAGFLRIIDGDEVLDSTSIHPESYELARKIMKVSNVSSLGSNDIIFNDQEISLLDIDEYTLKDIKDNITKPLRDYRDQFVGAVLKSDIVDIKDLKKGDKIQGTVRNVVDFGVFVDIGLHDDGLIHISRLSAKKVNHPSEVLAVGDIIDTYIHDIDLDKNRISLSLLSEQELTNRYNRQKNFTKNPIKKKITAEESMQKLLEKYGKKYD